MTYRVNRKLPQAKKARARRAREAIFLRRMALQRRRDEAEARASAEAPEPAYTSTTAEVDDGSRGPILVL